MSRLSDFVGTRDLAVNLTLRELRGRYKRSGRMDKATRVTGNFSKTGGVITLENQAKGSEFVFGERQIPSFIGLHPRFSEVAEKWSPLLSSQLQEDWLTVADPFAGVRP